MFNKLNTRKLFILGLSVITIPKGQAAFFKEHAQGWHWYEPFVIEEKEPSLKKKPLLKKASPPDASMILTNFKKELKRRLDKALVYPTAHNLKAYMRLQKVMMDRASTFGEKWMEVVYRNPELDYTATHPVNQVGVFTASLEKRKKLITHIQDLSKSHGLFFFFKSNCAYCHAFAPIVKSFSQKYGWSVLAISMDGSSLPDFPEAIRDNGTAERLNVTLFPTLLAVNPRTEDIVPLSYGLTSHDQIEERILLLRKGRPHA